MTRAKCRMAQDVAEELRLKVGDVITWDVQGLECRRESRACVR